MGAKYTESKMIIFLCKLNTIKWLESTIKYIIDINEWYELYLSQNVDNLDRCQVKKYMEEISKNSICGNIENLFGQITKLAIFLDGSKENFPTLTIFSSTCVADLAWLFSRKIEELNYIERRIEIIQNELNLLENKIHDIMQIKEKIISQ